MTMAGKVTFDDETGYSCCGGYSEHRYRCPNRVWPATATPEIRRTAIRGDCIAPAHAQIEDLVRGGLDYQQRKRLTEILAGIWDDGCEYGRRITADEGQIAEGTVRDD
jgi:hypothetical protein